MVEYREEGRTFGTVRANELAWLAESRQKSTELRRKEEGDMLKISTFSKKIFTPMFWAFCCAIRRASSEMSQAVTFDPGSSAAKVQAIQPLPVPMSNMLPPLSSFLSPLSSMIH